MEVRESHIDPEFPKLFLNFVFLSDIPELLVGVQLGAFPIALNPTSVIT